MSRFRHGVFPWITISGKEKGKAVQVEVMTSDYQIMHQTTDQIMKTIDKHIRYVLDSRRLYLQAETIWNGEDREQD